METESNLTPAELGNAELLRAQIEQFTNYNQDLTGGGSAKKIMADINAKSADLWQVAPEEIVVVPGYNPRVHNATYYEGIAILGQQMAKDGYMKDKPLSVYIAKIDGVDRLVLQDGHRRHAAVVYAKGTLGAPIKTVPVIVKDKSNNAVDLLKSMLHANEATPFTVYEKAVIAKRFKSYGWTDKQIAEEMLCTPAFVGQLLGLAGAPQAIQEMVESGQMAATAALDIVRKHGEEAVSVATTAVKRAKAAGKSRATAKDLTPAEDRTAQKLRNARKVALEMYKILVKISKDDAVLKKMEDRLIEDMDALIATVEKVRKPKEPKPVKAAKPAKAAKVAGKKVAPIKVKAPTAAKKTAKPKKVAPWDQPKLEVSERPQARSERRGQRAYGRRSMQ